MAKNQHPPAFKTKVVLEALKEGKTMAELAGQYQLHPSQIRAWKAEALKGLETIFADKRRRQEDKSQEQETQELYRQIGKLKVEVDWLKKNPACPTEQRKQLIDKDHPNITIGRQAQLLGISRSTVYYRPRGKPENLELMRLIDEIYTERPIYGSRKMRNRLRVRGHRVGRHRVRRLMRLMGLVAIYPKPNLSKHNPDHKVYPYLLRNLAITRPNQVWSTDITYVRLKQGWIYVAAVIDWHTRYVLSWEVSTTIDSGFCQNALRRALEYGTPDIFNTDQGTQFTATEFTDILKERNIRISMDGRGRAIDNIFVERLWRSLKYEEVGAVVKCVFYDFVLRV